MLVSKALNGEGNWVAVLAEPAEVAGIPCNAGTEKSRHLEAYPNGQIRYAELLRPITYRDHACSEYIFLWPDGKLGGTNARADHQVGNVSCAAGPYGLWENGGILSCVLAQTFRGHGAVLHAGSHVEFHPNGTLSSANVGSEGMEVADGRVQHVHVEFDTTGHVAHIIEKSKGGGY